MLIPITAFRCPYSGKSEKEKQALSHSAQEEKWRQPPIGQNKDTKLNNLKQQKVDIMKYVA